MKFAERPGLGGYEYPRHHVVYKPGGTYEAELFPHGEEGFASAVAKVNELGGRPFGKDANLTYANSSWSYLDAGEHPFLTHGRPKASGGDGVEHNSGSWRTEILDQDRLRIAGLGELKTRYPDLDILLGAGGEDVIINHRFPSGDERVRSLLVHSAHTLDRLNPPIPDELAKPENMVVIVRETGKDRRSLLGLLDVDAWRPSQLLEVRLYEDGLGVDPSELLESVAAGLTMFRTRTNILDRRYQLKTTATCDAHLYGGDFPPRLSIVLDAIEDQKVQVTRP